MHSAIRRRLTLFLGLTCLLVAGVAAVLYALQVRGIAPRTLAPYLERRAAGHNALIVSAAGVAARTLNRLDRDDALAFDAAPLAIGAQAGGRAGAGTADIVVASSAEARVQIARATAGTVIVFAPGRYRFADRSIVADHAGSAAAPIVVRAVQAGSVVLEFDLVEGFKVAGPYWRFENLVIEGVCAEHSQCEHAFHVIGDAHHFTASNNTIRNFNAHFKINGVDGHYPDSGVLAANSLSNTAPRQTANPVAPIDLVGASGWTVQSNLISDFVKAGGNHVSYGAFAKGGGSGNTFAANIVLCEQHLQGLAGERIGLSFGGGGTGPTMCRDRRCITEQSGSTMVANLVSACSDDGIYLNSAADSRIVHNSLIDTAGIDVRFATSSARLEGNLVDGAIRVRDGALLHADDNLATPLAQLYLGSHPQRALYRVPARGDFGWADAVPRRAAGGVAPAELCGAPRPAAPAYGAFEDFSACRGGAR